MSYPIQSIRSDFPVLGQVVNLKPLAYLDSASTTQKPQTVLDAMSTFYAAHYANVHRGMYPLASSATEQFESARKTVADFLCAASTSQIIWTSGTTASINLVAQDYVRPRLGPGDAVAVTIAEHHSNFVPWQQLCQKVGAELRVIPLTHSGSIDLEAAAEMLDAKVRLLAFTHISNVTGVLSPVGELIALAHRQGIPVLLDSAQSVARLPIDVQALDVDFLVFSGHKLYGPTGIGVLYAKQALLEQMQPSVFGGEMIASVSTTRSTWNELPQRFEAGTPNIVGAIGLAAAIEYVQRLGLDAIGAYERSVLVYAATRLQAVPKVQLVAGNETLHRHGLISFTFGICHSHDVATVLGEQAVAVRGGDHCAQPLHSSLALKGSIRASLGMYSTKEDVDRLIEGLQHAHQVLGNA